MKKIKLVKKKNKKDLKRRWGDCEACSLSKKRGNIVFGKGSIKSKVLMIGEAPGKNEDEEGIPFVGKAGKKLKQLFQRFGIDIEDFYITNTCICRPPGNRNPKASEVRACWPRLKYEIEMVNPKIIIYCGMRAAYLSEVDKEIKHFLFKYETCGMNHPASILYNPDRQAQILKQIKGFKDKIIKAMEEK